MEFYLCEWVWCLQFEIHLIELSSIIKIKISKLGKYAPGARSGDYIAPLRDQYVILSLVSFVL